MADLLFGVLQALLEALFFAPFPKRGENFATWWASRSFLGKVHTALAAVFIVFLMICLLLFAVFATIALFEWATA